jgi:hypothetical protein
MQRRSLLKLGVASAVVLGVAGGTAALWQPGMDGGRLTDSGRRILRAVGLAILDGSLPREPAAARAAIAGFLERMDALIAALPVHAQSELGQLLALLASAPGRRLVADLDTDWDQATVTQLQSALESMRRSRVAVRRQAYHALHDLTGGAYFSAPSTWLQLGYPGPIAI